jgi:uncharacterized protein
MPTYKTPDVYIEEISVFPPSVAEVETAIPAFIGYTEIAKKNAVNDLILKPTKIYSLKEYEQYYGYPKDDAIAITVANDSVGGFTVSAFTEPPIKYLMYYSIKMFFDNGGGQCYIISVGTYQSAAAINLNGDSSTNLTTMYGLQDGLDALALEDEPTLILIPEAVKLTPTDYQTLVQAVLLQCNKLRDRFAIFDIYDGGGDPTSATPKHLTGSQLSTNREYFGNNYLKYGSAYYPFIKTTLNFYVNDFGIASINVTSGGTGYTSATTVDFIDGGGIGAKATVTVSGDAVTRITIDSPGSGYTSPPTIIFKGAGTGAKAVATVGETNVMVTPPVAKATATAILAGDRVNGITGLVGGVGYTSAPRVTFDKPPSPTGVTATATATLEGDTVNLTVLEEGGSGYTSAPKVTFEPPPTGVTATATATLEGDAVNGITGLVGGAGYTFAPKITFDPSPTGVRATATVNIAGGAVTGITGLVGGSGYTSTPNVTFTSPSPIPVNIASLKTTNTALYNFVKSALKEHFITLPPSGAVVGIYAATDSNRGVWKAPANISLTNVIEPVIKLDNTKQDDLNVDATTGKSINAIRAFMGKGTLVWGARTLAGNDNEWRYVPVRRLFSVVEESVKKSTYWAVFEPNDANTWVKVRGMIENYLTQKWREGALAGATPKEAFFVKCGLGVTMTAIDILEGRMNVEIGMAAVRPAEFIILKFSHKLQTS